MAGWGRNGTQAAQPLEKTTETRSKGTRRKFSLIVITSLLNVLLWSSLLCIAASLYQIISEPKDTSIYAQVVLDITSAFAAVAYTLAHTIFSVKQKSWDQQQRPTSSMGRASNIALRMVALLCALWLLTMGWNMILVARRPVCSRRAEGLGSWEYGTTCLASRVGVITASLALGVSCALFGILAKVSRPLEAHLFNHGYQPPIAAYSRPYNPRPSTSHSRSQYFGDNFEPQERPLSMRGADESNSSTADARMIDPAERPGSSSNVSGQFTARPGDPEVFTSHHKPPPIPAEYITPQRKPWPGVSAPVHPSYRGGDSSTSSSRSSSRSSSPNGSSGSRQILPAQSSESALRAAHPNPESLALVTRSRSQKSRAGFSYQNPYSRSSIALTRPKRLSYASSGASMSSRNRLSRSDSRDSSRRESSAYERASFDEVARALVKGIPVPSIAHPSHRAGSIRITTKLDTNPLHDTTYMTGALAIPSNNGGLSREPSLNGSEYEEGSEEHRNYVRSTSPGYSMLFSPDNSPTDDVNPNEIQKPVSTTPIPRKPSPARRRDSVRSSSALTAAEAARAMINNLPQDLPLPKHESARAKIKPGKSREFEEMKNKPLPRIAYL